MPPQKIEVVTNVAGTFCQRTLTVQIAIIQQLAPVD
jgi:hypothetical protein